MARSVAPQAQQTVQVSLQAASRTIVFSQPTEVDLVVYRGDTGRFRVSVSNPDGSPLDVSAATWDCDIRTSEDAEPPLASLNVYPVAGETDTIEVQLNSITSRTLTGGVWDLEMTLGGEVQTLLKGRVIVQKDVSRT